MEIRPITERFAVSPQISPDDAAAIREAGFNVVINNRPDRETTAGTDAASVRAALEAEGISVIENPLVHGTLDMGHVTRQRAAIEQAADSGAAGKVLAYCASGNRSTILWALAVAGDTPTDQIVARAAAAGYDVSALVPQMEMLAAGNSSSA